MKVWTNIYARVRGRIRGRDFFHERTSLVEVELVEEWSDCIILKIDRMDYLIIPMEDLRKH